MVCSKWINQTGDSAKRQLTARISLSGKSELLSSNREAFLSTFSLNKMALCASTLETRNKASFLQRSRYFTDALDDFENYCFKTATTLY